MITTNPIKESIHRNQQHNQKNSYNNTEPLVFHNTQNISLINNQSTSQVKPSDINRSRIFSYQDHHRPSVNFKYTDQNPILLSKIKQKHNVEGFKQSNGIMNKPPEYIENKYTFKNQFNGHNNESDCMWYPSCCSIIKQTRRQVYLSPTQLISAGYFYKNLKTDAKSLKFQKQGGHVGQKSFFRETNNFIQ